MSERVVRRNKITRVQIEVAQETSQESTPFSSLGSPTYQGCLVGARANRRFTSEAKSTHRRIAPGPRSFGYPDTAESGDTYDIEAFSTLKSTPLFALVEEYSE